MKNTFFTGRKVLGIFAGITFLAGFFLLDLGSFTGNAVLDSQSSINPVAVVGLVLIACSAVFAGFALKGR